MTTILTAAEREQLQSRPALTIKRDHGHALNAAAETVTMRGNPVHQLVGRVIRRSNDKPLRSELLMLTREQADWIDGIMWAQRDKDHIAGMWFEAGRHRFDVEWKLPGGPVVVVRQGIEGFAPFSEHHASPMAFAKAYGLDEDSGPQNDVQAAAGVLTQKPVEC